MFGGAATKFLHYSPPNNLASAGNVSASCKNYSEVVFFFVIVIWHVLRAHKKKSTRGHRKENTKGNHSNYKGCLRFFFLFDFQTWLQPESYDKTERPTQVGHASALFGSWLSCPFTLHTISAPLKREFNFVRGMQICSPRRWQKEKPGIQYPPQHLKYSSLVNALHGLLVALRQAGGFFVSLPNLLAGYGQPSGSKLEATHELLARSGLSDGREGTWTPACKGL